MWRHTMSLLWHGVRVVPAAATPGKAYVQTLVYSACLHLNISAANIKNAERKKKLFIYKLRFK